MPMHNICGCAGPGQFYTGVCCLGVQAGSRTHCALPAALSGARSRHGAAPRLLLAPALLAAPLACAPAPRPQGDAGSQQHGHECTIPQGTGQLCPQQCCRLLPPRHGRTASPRQPLPCSGTGTGTGLGTGTLPAGCPAQLWVWEGRCALAAYLLIQPQSSLARVPHACSYLSKHMPEEVQLNCPCNAMREWLLACLEERSSYRTKWKTDWHRILHMYFNWNRKR